MPRRLIQEEFIERARSVHGDKYDYSKVEYERLSMKVCIICPEHGEFWQRAGQHLDGNGCPKCAHISRAKTCLERYGIAHPCASAESLKKAKLTVRDKYGVDNVFQCDSIKAKIRQTNMERYGVENPMQSATILAKAQATNVEKYGVPCSMQAESVKHKHRQSVFKKYGVENSMCVPEVRAKAVQTCLDRYGVANPRCSPVIDEKIRNTCMERYGVPYVVESADVRAKSEMSKRERGTFNSSRPAGVMKTILCDIFGNDNVRSEYDEDERYPFHCDFYIVSRDMFIELNAFVSHGTHWFDKSSVSDLCALDVLLMKSETSEFYRNMVHTWTQSDVEKRMCAEQFCLNYLTFWRSDLSDFKEWVAAGCPDGQDWVKEYSWKEQA